MGVAAAVPPGDAAARIPLLKLAVSPVRLVAVPSDVRTDALHVGLGASPVESSVLSPVLVETVVG